MATIIHESDRHGFRLAASGVADFDFAGGDITSVGGVLWIHDFCEALGVRDVLSERLESHPPREYDDADVAYFKALSLCMGELRDRCAEHLRLDPAFLLATGGVPSQETVSRRLSGMGAEDVAALKAAVSDIMDRVARLREPRDLAVVDLDSTLLGTYGKQDKSKWNKHYDAVGYHPLLATDTGRREVLGVPVRGGTDWCREGAAAFFEGIAGDMIRREPGIGLCVRGDSGFATPEIYETCERHGWNYVIRMKNIPKLVATVDANLVEPMVPGVPRRVTGEVMYQARSWSRPRRIVYEVIQPEGQLLPEYLLIVTNSHARVKDVLRFYRERGETGQLVGEHESFASGCVSSRSFEANDFRCQLALLAHCLVAWFRSLCLPESMSRREPMTIVRDVLRFGAKLVNHARRHRLKVTTAYPHKRELALAAHRSWEAGLRLAA